MSVLAPERKGICLRLGVVGKASWRRCPLRWVLEHMEMLRWFRQKEEPMLRYR